MVKMKTVRNQHKRMAIATATANANLSWLFLLLLATLSFPSSAKIQALRLLPAAFSAFRLKINFGYQNIFFCGGSDDQSEQAVGLGEDEDESAPSDNEKESLADEHSVNATIGTESRKKQQTKHRKRSRIRHTSDMLYDLIERSAITIPESVKLRQLITQRSKEYTEDIFVRRKEDPMKKLTHPKKLLHFIAPKIPAIKHSPDVTLRIQTTRTDMDAGVAACLIGTLAHICEIYDNELLLQTREKEEASPSDRVKEVARPASSSVDLIKDRRFEQVVECLLCGVDVEKRMREHMTNYLDAKKSDDETGGNSNDVDNILEGEQVQVREGLYIRDACRAAWGLAILGANHCGTLGGTKVIDLHRALSLRIRESLLSRLQLLRQGDLMEDIRVLDENFAKLSPEERLYELSEELAEDAATAMWTFACVRACTGMRSAPLFETCCSILCQDPFEIRKQAQEAQLSTEQSTIGVNDVVDRLARSEIEDKGEEGEKVSENTTAAENIESHPAEPKATTNLDSKETLIDWLSPNELTDVLWALALHGHSDSNVREEIILSENAAVLKEIAFDRLMFLLREDYTFLQKSQEEQNKTAAAKDELINSSKEEYVTKEGETMTVEVVDAAALLASENAAKTAVVSSVENMTKQNPSGGLVGTSEQVEVVDAAAILQTSGDHVDHELLTAEREVLVDEEDEQTTLIEEAFTGENDTAESNTVFEEAIPVEDLNSTADSSNEIVPTPALSDQMYFSAHDLCALAWAVTELRDSLRFQIVDLVINIFANLGEDSVENMTGSDLANLAWAISRHILDARPWSSKTVNRNSLSLTIWMVKRALITSGGHLGGRSPPNVIHMLDSFQPPELSRMMWAVASTVRAFTDKDDDYYPAVDQLAINALLTTASNLSLFSAEDMVRIFWAFLELCDMDEALAYPGVANALGKILSSIETTILRWERGRNYIRPEEAEASNKEAARFTSLFLRPKLSRQLLDQIIDEYNGMEEEDEKILSSFAEEKRSKLPRLRDLGIDPTSLCKAAGASAKLSMIHPNICGSPTLTRVTLKLLTSKNGRLLREFSMTDLIRACEAAAINDAMGLGEDLVVGHFSRRFIQLLNEANSPDNDDYMTQDSQLKLSSASPNEIATLIWSLGELGARHVVSDKERQTAHRKLRLVYEKPLLMDDQVQHLSTRSALKLLRGLASMNVIQTDKTLVIKILELLKAKITTFHRESDLCDLTESVAAIRQSLGNEDLIAKHANTTSTKTKDLNQTSADLNVTEGSVTSATANGTEGTSNSTTITDYDRLKEICEEMLTTLAKHGVERVGDLRTDSLRRLLTVYSLLPFQADELVDVFESEVSQRQLLLEAASSTRSIEELLNTAAKNALSANTTVFGKEEDGSSAMAALRNGLKSIFAPAEIKDEEQSQEMKEFTEEVGALLNKVTASVTKVDECMEQIGSASNIHTDTALQGIVDGTNFELGRCRELIDNYRRVEFSTGRRRSRYDYESSRDIGKRLLSRLIPR